MVHLDDKKTGTSNNINDSNSSTDFPAFDSGQSNEQPLCYKKATYKHNKKNVNQISQYSSL